MTFSIFLNVLAIALLLASLPLLLELLVLSVAALLPVRAVPQILLGQRVKLAVVVPAHNEAQLIRRCVQSILASAEPNITVYVIAHNCTDNTAELARSAGAHVFTLQDSIGGKGTALDFGFTEATARGAEAVLVVDADSVVGSGMIAHVTAAFTSGVEALQCRYEVANRDQDACVKLAALAFLGMNVLRPLGRSQLGLSCGIFGNGFGLRTDMLARVPYAANSLVEDLEYHLHLVRAGVRVHFLNQVAVYGEMPGNSAATGSQRARWEGGRIRMRRLWTRPLTAQVLRGRWRMVEPLLDLLALPLGSEVAVLGLTLLLGSISGKVWLIAYGGLGVLTAAFYLGVAASLGAHPRESLTALVAAPRYLVWKFFLQRKTRRAARSDAPWIRTAREAETPGKFPQDHAVQSAGQG